MVVTWHPFGQNPRRGTFLFSWYFCNGFYTTHKNREFLSQKVPDVTPHLKTPRISNNVSLFFSLRDSAIQHNDSLFLHLFGDLGVWVQVEVETKI